MSAGTVVVPEGHKVVVFGPSPQPFLARAESGWLILNFGDGKDLVKALESIEGIVAGTEKLNVVWILQSEFLEALLDLKSFLARVGAVVVASKGRMGHVAVFATEAAKRVDIMNCFRQLGLGVHYSDPDGACFVEVHRPDGIVVGMPGKAFDGGAV
jgi:hypothetical protein